jgi:hypothetical protein
MPRKPFVKGVSPNPGGKPKDGSPRRPNGSLKKQRLKVREILESMDFRPFEEMVLLYRTTSKERVKVDILIDLCSYIAPKLKHVEISGDNENPFIINLNLKPGEKRLELNQVVDEVIDGDDEGI